MIRNTLIWTLGAVAGIVPRAVLAQDWPQAGANAARTQSVATELKPPFELAWNRRFVGEVITPIAQPIVVGRRVYIGSENGVVHALDLKTGGDVWATRLGAGVCNALAADSRRLYAAALDGAIYGLDRSSGQTLWTSRLSRRGFTTAPLLLDGAIVAGSRDGTMYCIEAETGRRVWSHATPAPIFQTAAGAAGRVVFMNAAMHVFCLDARDGHRLWRAGPLPGDRNDYWPLVHQGRVVITLPELGRPSALQQKLFWPVEYNRPVERVTFQAKTMDDMIAEQEIFHRFFEEHPRHRRLFVFDLADGGQPYVPSLVRGASENGEPMTVAGDGHLYSVFRTSAAQRGLINITRCALGRFDLATGRLAKPIVCGDFELAQIVQVRSPWELTSDEPVTLAAAGRWLVGMRCNETPGAIRIGDARGVRLPGAPAPFASDLHNAQAPPVVAGGSILTTKFGQITCVRSR